MKLIFTIILLLFPSHLVMAQEATNLRFGSLASTVERAEFNKAKKLIAEIRNDEPNLSDHQKEFVAALKFYLNEQPESSNSILERLIKLDKSAATRFLYATTLSASGNTKKAISLIQNQAPAAHSSASWTLLAQFYLNEGRLKDAENALAAALETEKSNPDALFTRGFVRWNMGKTVDALSDFKAAHMIRPSGPFRNETVPYLVSGVHYAKQGKYELAINNFEFALAIEPNSIEANSAMWKAYSQTKQHAKALPFAQKLAELAPESLDTIRSNAETLMFLNRIRDAAPYVNKWHRRSPKDAIVNLFVAYVYLDKRKYAEAFRHATLSRKYAPLEHLTRLVFVRVGMPYLKSEQFQGSDHDKSELQNEISDLTEQLCAEANWSKPYLNLALEVYDGFGQKEKAEKVKQRIRQAANTESSPLIKQR